MKQGLIDAYNLQMEGYLKLFDRKCTDRDLAFLNVMVEEQPTVEAIPIKDIKDFLRCEKIDSCDWLNCSECSQMKCISIRNLSDLIEWSKKKENARLLRSEAKIKGE